MSRVPNPDAVWPGENYLVCYKTQMGDEIITQSELTAERAERSADILTEHAEMNARSERYYWRIKAANEVIPTGERCMYA
jgi:hypothetical protein